jgi:hypothetical protein
VAPVEKNNINYLKAPDLNSKKIFKRKVSKLSSTGGSCLHKNSHKIKN